jgi:tetratricopeptide (TPR) repeat protein
MGGLAVGLLSLPAQSQTPSPDRAISLEQQGDLAGAEREWRQWLQDHPMDAEAFASLGVLLSKERQYKDAAAAYRRALTLNAKLRGIQLNLGLAEFKQGEFQAAIAPFRMALAAEPDNIQARTLLGLSYYGTKRFDEAVKHLEMAARSDATNLQLHHVLAQSCLWAKKYSCALDEFRKIQEQDPNSAASHVLTAEALDGLGRTSEAIAEFQAAAKMAPREPNVHFGIGYLYWKQHKYDEAKSALEEELAIDSTNSQAMAYLGDIAIKQSDPEKALPLLKNALQLKGDLRIAYLDLGILLADRKEFSNALAALRRAEELDPSQPDAHYRMGRIYKQMGNSAASEKEFAKVRELHEKDAVDIVHQMSNSPPPLKP